MILVQNFNLLTKDGGEMLLFFGADMISSVHIDNENKDIVTIDEGAMQLLDDTTVSAEAKYPNNLSNLSRDLY